MKKIEKQQEKLESFAEDCISLPLPKLSSHISPQLNASTSSQLPAITTPTSLHLPVAYTSPPNLPPVCSTTISSACSCYTIITIGSTVCSCGATGGARSARGGQRAGMARKVRAGGQRTPVTCSVGAGGQSTGGTSTSSMAC